MMPNKYVHREWQLPRPDSHIPWPAQPPQVSEAISEENRLTAKVTDAPCSCQCQL